MATDFWSEYRRLKKKQLEDTNVNAPVKETTTSSSSDEGSVFWDEYRQNKKDRLTSTATETAKKEEKEKEEKKAEQKTLQKSTSTTSPTSEKLVNGKLMQTQTKQVIKEEGVSPGDIAPVKTHGGAGGGFGDATDGKNDSWIKKSEGNLWQTILGSGTDLTEHVTASAIGVGEKIVDALTTVGTLIGQSSLSQTASDEMLYNAIHGKEDENVLEKYEGVKKEIEEKSAEFIAKDLYDEEAIAKTIISDPMRRKHGINSEWHSIFGEKSDELAMSAGQLGVQLGANVLLPGSGIAVMGASTFGSEVESAFRNGATFGDAVLSASISTAAEVLTERLGGISFGGKTVTDSVFGELSSRVTGKFARALVAAGKLATDASFEAAEEVVSGYISAWGQTISYMDDKEIEELFSKEDALDAAIGGFVLGGVFNVGEAAITGRDPASGLTKNEQAVVDKEVERRVAEQEKGGKKLITKEIGAIKKQVQDDMEHGQLDIEMIEEVLGGDSYTAYKDTVESEDGLKAEYEQLADIKESDLTTKQKKRIAELEAMNLGDTTKRDDLRKKLNETVFPQLKDSKLAESYNQVAKKGEAFKADLSKYKGKQREAVERAMKSGVLNDTFRSHELVDVLSKIEAEKGIVFDYTNNAKLKESGFALEGKTVNGYANKKQGSVTLNVQSAKAWQSVVGHEITHVLETNPEAYKALRESLYAYAESRGELESRRAATTALYDGMDADIEAELTADLVGDYLFTDKNFVNKLAGNRTLFQKVYDEIKYLWNVATGKEKTEIEKVKDEFDRVLKEYGKEKSQEAESQEYSDDDLSYSISEIVDENGTSYGIGVKLDSTLLDDLTPDERVEMVKLRVGELGGQSFTAFDRNGKAVNVMIAKSTREFKNKNGGKSFVNQDLVGYNKNPVKQEAVVLVDELITASAFKGTEPAKHPHGWVDDNGKNDWDVWETYIQDKNKTVWKAKLRIANSTNGEKILYDVFPIEKVGGVKTLDTTPSDNSIAPIPENVNTQFSLSSDNEGNQLSNEQSEYFADSKIRDENGRLKVMYHGTPSGDFTVFKDGTYFTENKWYADLYQNPGASSLNSRKAVTNPKTYEVYLDIKKPFDISDPEARDIYINDYIKGGNAVGIDPYLSDAEYAKIDSIDWTEGEDLREFLVDNGYDYDGLVLYEGAVGGYGDDVKYRGKSYVIFNPEQVKDVENKNPTADPDIRFSISPDTDADYMSAVDRYSDMTEKSVFRTRFMERNRGMVEAIAKNRSKTATDGFKKWFGKSVVTNKDGEPLLVYRGTNSDNSVLDHNQKPIWFSNNVMYAETYSGEVKWSDRVRRSSKIFGGAEKKVIPAYIRIENPADFGDTDAVFSDSLPSLSRKLGIAEEDMRYVWEKNGRKEKVWETLHTSEMASLLSEYGYDGATAVENGCNTWCVFDSRQVKSAVANNGNFNSDNPDIRKSISREGESFAPVGNYSTPFRELALDAPVAKADVADNNVGNIGVSDNVAPIPVEEEETVVQDAPVADTKQMFVDAPMKNPKGAHWLNTARTHLLDDASVFEDLAKKTKNRELEAKFNFTKSARARAQSLIGNGKKDLGIKSLTSIHEAVQKTGKEAEFEDYMYHLLNIDRMTMNERYGTNDIPVFGYDITADMSRQKVLQYQRENPEFKNLASEIYKYMRYERQLMVDGGLISQETADLWQEQTPHYIPIKRAGFDDGFEKTLNTDKKVKADSVVKKVIGGNQPMEHMWGVIADRTERVYSAIAKNRFGVELKNTLNSVIESETATQEDVDNGMDRHEDLLQKGKDGKNPTFTVFENGKKVTFEINNDMYEALKPSDPMWQGTSKFFGGLNDFRRGVLTEYSVPFIVTNAIKDAQDVVINSQHPVKTYKNIPKAIKELKSHGKWFTEYMENGGEQNTFFDEKSGKVGKEEDNRLKKVVGMPLRAISNANNFMERIPRLAEYIASRENGASIEVAMLDAARVTTNFQAGGDITKWANRNGFTFLNASVQGALQQVRNVREAKMNGLKGWTQLAAKTLVAGLPAMLLNALLWDDDEEYEELSDYVKDNYYIVAKYGDGKFVRIPKGRTAAVIQNAFEQIGNLITGDDEVDLGRFTELVINNLAPANPLENNVIAPITQALSNKTWYGDDLVPSRLQDLPAEEQYDETTDAISKWLGENIGGSPYKWNYVIDQYSGGIGDIVLPWLTPEAERWDNSLIAPIIDKFTTDSVMKNQNVSDFYTKKDELAVAANGSGATDEDVLMSKFMNSMNAEISALYAKKRELQSSDLSDAAKYKQVRRIQDQIVDLARKSLSTYEDIKYEGDYAVIGDRYFEKDDDGEWRKLTDDQVTKHKITSAAGDANYATDGNNHYRLYVKEGETEGEWIKLSGDELAKQKKVTSALGITAEEYWEKKDEYTFAYENPGKYEISRVITEDYTEYQQYKKEINAVEGKKDANGKTISGSLKDNVEEYIANMDIDFGAKLLLFKMTYPKDNTYNNDIIDYLNSRDDLTYEQIVIILKELGFNVSGNDVTW